MKLQFKKHFQATPPMRSKGFILPVVVILSIALAAMSVTAFRAVSNSSVALTDQYYQSLAQEAATAGVQMANSCLKENGTPWTDAAPLKPGTDCQGITTSGALTYVSKNDNWTSEFSVKAPVKTAASTTITVNGTVSLRAQNNTVVQTYTKNVKALFRINIGAGFKPVTGLSTGWAHTCIASEGNAYCWGLNSTGQIGDDTLSNANAPVTVSKSPIPAPARVAVPAGCGSASKPCTTPAIPAQPASALAGKTVSRITAGNNHTCAIADDKAYCWGDNAHGQLGNAAYTRTLVPIAVNANPLATPAIPAVPAGCGSSSKPCTTPVIAAQPASSLANKKVIDIEAGNLFTCALTDDGAVSCWGENAYGQLGLNDRTDRYTPASAYTTSGSPLFNKRVKKIGKMSNNQHTCVITQDDTPVCWGRNYGGQIGNDVDLADDRGTCGFGPPAISSSKDALVPTNVYSGDATPNSSWFGKSTRPASSIKGKKIVALNTVGTYTNVIDSEGHIHWWGGYSYAHTVGCQKYDPIKRKYVSDRQYVRSYNSHSRPVGPIYFDSEACWSWPTFTCPINNLLTNKTITVSSGSVNSGVFCAVANNEVICDGPWYYNYQGQLGDGRALGKDFGNWDFSPDPVRVRIDTWLNGRTVSDLETGGADDWWSNGSTGSYTCALADQSVACWGINGSGQLGTGDKLNKNVPTPVFTGGALSKPNTVTLSNPIIF
jgi:alpha-tubulin suppressor-like RCC1 family protein